nr:hypothetical protein BaRGS_002650 [Batillaria attramentaria]
MRVLHVSVRVGFSSLRFEPIHEIGYRKKGEKFLHSKYIVIVVIILTITDCSLVIAELILDLYSVKTGVADW